MKAKIDRTAAALCAGAGFWALWCICLPLWRPVHWVLLVLGTAAVAALTFAILKKKLPASVTTGDEALDRLIETGLSAAAEMDRIGRVAPERLHGEKIQRLGELTEQIFRDLYRDPADAPRVRRFAGYFLPTAEKLLQSYEESWRAEGALQAETKGRIEAVLDSLVAAWQSQLDALYQNDALDIETDLSVLKTMLKSEGLVENTTEGE